MLVTNFLSSEIHAQSIRQERYYEIQKNNNRFWSTLLCTPLFGMYQYIAASNDTDCYTYCSCDTYTDTNRSPDFSPDRYALSECSCPE